MNIVISSEMRVGSRWLHYLLKDLYNMRVSPEIGKHRFYDKEFDVQSVVNSYFNENRIVKFHGLLAEEIFNGIGNDFKLICIVRNPRDRLVSLGLHHKYEKGYGNYKGISDEDAIKKVMNSSEFKTGNHIIHRTMIPEFNSPSEDIPYFWTSYEWMIEDNFGEIFKINKYLGMEHEVADEPIINAVIKHSFENRAGRKAGDENRNDVWRRKGIIGDWINWFDGEMFDATKSDWDIYWNLIESSKNT